MAVNIDFKYIKDNGNAFLLKLGVDQSTLKGLLDLGWEVKLTYDKIEFVNEDDVKHVPVTIDQLHALKNDTLNVVTKQQLLSAAEAVIAQIEDGAPTEAKSEPPQANEKLVEAKLSTPSMSFAKEKAQAPATPHYLWSIFDPKQMSTTLPVKLREASKMYQPVLGTSNGSRYFLVGGNHEVRIAARYQSTTLSVRVEGTGWAKYKMAIAGLGFDVNVVKDYASLHLEVGQDPVMANKTLGALLVGLGLPLQTPIPNVAVFKGKGA